MDDRVLARVPAAGSPGRPAYLAHSYGGSGDPMYYLIGEDGKRIGSSVDGDLLAIPAEGDAWMYQRTNSMYARRRRIRIDGSGVHEVPTRMYAIGLRTIALGAFHLRRSITDSTVVAEVAGGDSVVVVEADEIAENATPAFHVRTSAGAEGWVRISGAQCNMGLIKGLCWWGD